MTTHAAPGNPRRAVVVAVIPPEEDRVVAQRAIDETVRLVETAGGIVVVQVVQKRGRPSARTYLGTGKAVEVGAIAREERCDLVIVHGMLKPTQAMHLRKTVQIPVWDRIDVLLTIFARHARTAEAKLQIELASLRYELPKLYGRGVEFSRLGGGVGTRGPGEQYLETQKRSIKRRIAELERRLVAVQAVRGEQRARRKRSGVRTVALVGYTNTGKSSLLRALTRREALVANQLFSTLDTRLAQLWVGDRRSRVLLADTIGFIADLPPSLLASFRSTLAEAREADLLLEVIDAADLRSEEKHDIVSQVLAELGAASLPRLLVVNKVDLVPDVRRRAWQRWAKARGDAVLTSAETGAGLPELLSRIRGALGTMDEESSTP